MLAKLKELQLATPTVHLLHFFALCNARVSASVMVLSRRRFEKIGK